MVFLYVVSVNQPWKQSEHLYFSVTDFVAIRPKSSMSWQTVTFLLRTLQPDPPVQEYSAGKTFTMCPTLFQNPRVVELILGSMHMHQCLLMTLILASEAAVKAILSYSYEPKQLGKNTHHTNMYQNVCVCVCRVLGYLKQKLTHQSWRMMWEEIDPESTLISWTFGRP